MKIIISLTLLTLFLFSQEDIKEAKNDTVIIDNSFITKLEYGKMLYTNPRGIGCVSCHGKDAKGKKLVEFKHKKKKKSYDCKLIIPSIKEVAYDTFVEKLHSKKAKKVKFEKEKVCEKLLHYANVMPTYFLVDDEIEAIFYYIKSLK